MMIRLFRVLVPSVLGVLIAGGCEPTVVQYRTKPAYYSQMASASFRDGRTQDGVEIRWREPEAASADPFAQRIGTTVFRIREESEDGEVTLRAKLPQHVLVNLLACLRNAEYELIWSQLLASSTRQHYERLEDGYEEYEAFLRKHRKDLAELVNRMIVGRTFGEVEVQKAEDGTIRCRLRRKLRTHFTFKEVLMVPDAGELKLLTVR